MATNPIQQMIPMVLQQLTQNPQMLQQIMQMATGPVGQGILQMLMNPAEEKYTPGSGEQSPMPLPHSLGGGSPYPIGGLQDDDKVLRREMRQDQLGPEPMQEPLRLNPFLQRLLDDQPGVRPGSEQYLTPDYPEPIAQLQPGLLTRLAMSLPNIEQFNPNTYENQHRRRSPEPWLGDNQQLNPWNRDDKTMYHPDTLRGSIQEAVPPNWIDPGMLKELPDEEDEETIEQES